MNEVQKLVQKDHALIEQFHDVARGVYKAVAQLFAEYSKIRKQFDPFHPNLVTFMLEAMRIFADRKLS